MNDKAMILLIMTASFISL